MFWWHISAQNILLATSGAELMHAEVSSQWEPRGAWMLYQCGAIRCVFKSKWQTRILKLNDILQTLDIVAGSYASRDLNLNLLGISRFLSLHRYQLNVASLEGKQLIMPPFNLFHHFFTYVVIRTVASENGWAESALLCNTDLGKCTFTNLNARAAFSWKKSIIWVDILCLQQSNQTQF